MLYIADVTLLFIMTDSMRCVYRWSTELAHEQIARAARQAGAIPASFMTSRKVAGRMGPGRFSSQPMSPAGEVHLQQMVLLPLKPMLGGRYSLSGCVGKTTEAVSNSASLVVSANAFKLEFLKLWATRTQPSCELLVHVCK